MTNVSQRGDLLLRGLSPGDLARMTRTGELTRIRRGAYVEARSVPRSASAAHRMLLHATLPHVSADAVVSHMSAALLHGLPVWNDQLTHLHLTISRSSGAKTRRYVRLDARHLEPDDVMLVDGITVTSLARTVVDLACRLNLERSVGLGDAALRLGLDPAALAVALDAGAGRVGIGRARQAVALLDIRSESPQESRSRVIFHLHGLPKPEPQWEVFDAAGDFVARVDFGWEELRTVGEFDGQTKYGRLLRPGQDPGAVVFEEKRREDALRDLRLQVVRWVTDDFRDPKALVARVQRALDRGRRLY